MISPEIKFTTKVEYVSGKLLVVADTLSRHPSAALNLQTTELSDNILALKEATQAARLMMSSSRLDEVKKHTKDDLKLQVLMHFVSNG